MNLTTLSLRDNQITSIEGLSGLANLKYFTLDDVVADPHRCVHRSRLRFKLGKLDESQSQKKKKKKNHSNVMSIL